MPVEALVVQPVVGEVIRRPVVPRLVFLAIEPNPGDEHEFAVVPQDGGTVGEVYVVPDRIEEPQRGLLLDVRGEGVDETRANHLAHVSITSRFGEHVTAKVEVDTESLDGVDRSIIGTSRLVEVNLVKDSSNGVVLDRHESVDDFRLAGHVHEADEESEGKEEEDATNSCTSYIHGGQSHFTSNGHLREC